MMKKVRSWNAMSSMGVIWISTSWCCIFFMVGSPRVAHRLEGELLEPVGLAGGDDAEELRERRAPVGPDDQRGGQGLALLRLLAGELQVDPGQAGLLLDLADGLLGPERRRAEAEEL